MTLWTSENDCFKSTSQSQSRRKEGSGVEGLSGARLILEQGISCDFSWSPLSVIVKKNEHNSAVGAVWPVPCSPSPPSGAASV